ncbi:MAG: zinc-dependent metalloprotease family protein [Thiotrichaceae bacterium]
MIYRSLLITLMFSLSSVHASSDDLWSDVAFKTQGKNSTQFNLMPDSYRLLNLNVENMRGELDTFGNSSYANKQTQEQLTLPLPNGESLVVNVTESSMMAPELAEQYPQIKTYRVDGNENKGIYGAIDVTPRGFHAMLFMRDGTRLFIDPRKSGDATFYISYYDKHYHPAEKDPLKCSLESHDHEPEKDDFNSSLKTALRTAQRTGTELRTYRLAMAATGEYTTFHGGTVAGGLSAITTTVNRVNVIYERDLAIKLELVANNNLLVFTDASNDPYSNGDGDAMIDQNQTEIDNTIKTANYDIGHVVGTGGGGLAQLAAVCGSNKARGITGSTTPSGDAFDIDFVAHEIGHQFGGTHTFNSTTGSCSGGNRTGSTAYEPGSGTTIMAYAGLCGGTNNTQSNSDAMFHVTSIVQIGAYIDDVTGGSACGTPTSLGNQQPVSNAGSDYTIPANTPFELTGSGTDANLDTLSYSWEQVDAGMASDINVVESDNAIFRTFLPKDTSTRVFPVLSSILNNTTSKGETLPSLARTLNFSLAVRDQKGGVAADEMLLTVANSDGFKITSHNLAGVLGPSSSTEVTWNVANTASSPIDCSAVDILFSTDGGNTFSLVSDDTANDGSETITIPASTSVTSAARFKVKCADNIFFDISDLDLSIQTSGLTIQSAILSNIGSNHVAEPGETVHLTIPIESFDSTVATNVSGVLSSTTASTNITVANSTYPDIQSSTKVNNATAYEVQIPANHNCGLEIPLTLNASYLLGSNSNIASDFSISVGVQSSASQANSTSQSIPDNDTTGITSSVTLTGQGIITRANISVDVNINHSYRGDLILDLTSPQGTTVRLKGTDTSDGTDNLVGNFPTNFTPEQTLSAFDGENLDGTWALKISDGFNNDTGTLNSWTLNYSQYTCGVQTNTAPVASNSSLTTTEATAATGTLQATDANSDALTYSIVTNGTKGSVGITNASTGAYTYTPASGQTGQDSFTFKVNDGTVDSNTATVSVTINAAAVVPTNASPVSSNGTVTMEEGAVFTGTLQATDSDNDSMTYSIMTNGAKGNAVIVNAATGAYTYTPASGQSGQDSFTFKANDGTTDSNTATITITINASLGGNGLTNNPSTSESSGGGGSFSWSIFPFLMLLSLLVRSNNRKNHLH